jgi:hypothetical protein
MGNQATLAPVVVPFSVPAAASTTTIGAQFSVGNQYDKLAIVIHAHWRQRRNTRPLHRGFVGRRSDLVQRSATSRSSQEAQQSPRSAK